MTDDKSQLTRIPREEALEHLALVLKVDCRRSADVQSYTARAASEALLNAIERANMVLMRKPPRAGFGDLGKAVKPGLPLKP